jgi:hypothetical protein
MSLNRFVIIDKKNRAEGPSMSNPIFPVSGKYLVHQQTH